MITFANVLIIAPYLRVIKYDFNLEFKRKEYHHIISSHFQHEDPCHEVRHHILDEFYRSTKENKEISVKMVCKITRLEKNQSRMAELKYIVY